MTRKLVIKREGDKFVVDEPSSPGMPPTGRGPSILSSIGSWFLNNSAELGFIFTSEGEAVKSVDRMNQRDRRKR